MEIFSFCECHWIIPWLLAGLLGLLLGWLLFSGARRRVQELEEENERLRGIIADLEGNLSDCNAKRAALDSELTLLKGTIREKEAAEAERIKKMSKEGSDSSDESTKGDDHGDEDPDIKEKMHSGSKLGIMSDSSGSDMSTTESKESVKSSDSLASGNIAGLAAVGGAASTSRQDKSRNIYEVLEADNLQIVEGIGPKMEEVLKNAGITSWSNLASSTPESLRNTLDQANPKRYRIIDPSSWSKQAKMAHSGDWEQLISYQKNLDGGKTDQAKKSTNSKVEKILIKMGALKQWKANDLKAIEGIGPKIEGLLKAAGIETWRKLSTTSEEKLKEILNNAGPRFRLADPSSWPKQSEMAADGRWDDLDEYQDFLQGGK